MFDRVLDRRVNLVLNRPVFCKSTCHAAYCTAVLDVIIGPHRHLPRVEWSGLAEQESEAIRVATY